MNGQKLTQESHGWQRPNPPPRPVAGEPNGSRRALAAVCQAVAVAVMLLLTAQCKNTTPPSGPTPPPPVDPGPTAATLVGAGDIAECPGASESTAALLDNIPGMVFTTGDNVYGGATLQRFQECYGPTWGRHRARTRPSLGNHDYDSGPAGYFSYFPGSDGPDGLGYYSYDYRGWHMVVVNSSIDLRAGSQQLQWIDADLAASGAHCTVAYWHRPLFSSSKTGSNGDIKDLWRVLYSRNVDVVLNGHDHVYERFAPQDPDGKLDTSRGIRQLTVGTGGASLYGFPVTLPNSEVRASTHGVLKLALEASGYSWEFISAASGSFRDTGRGVCH
jgi:3',5'-cyclic AMP phosphodiesterase CpdA